MRISDWSSDVCSSDLTSRSSEGSTAEVLAVVRVPLYQQGAASSRVREAKQVASQRRLQVREAIRLAREDAISAWESLLTARAQVAALEQSVRAHEIALEGGRQENAVGARTVLDVLDDEQEQIGRAEGRERGGQYG